MTGVQTCALPIGSKGLIDVLVESGLCTSKSDAKRVLSQNGIKVDGKIVTEENYKMRKSCVIQKGKRFFVKVIPS